MADPEAAAIPAETNGLVESSTNDESRKTPELSVVGAASSDDPKDSSGVSEMPAPSAESPAGPSDSLSSSYPASPPPSPTVPPPPTAPPLLSSRLQVEEGHLPKEVGENPHVSASEKKELQRLLRRQPWESLQQWRRREEFIDVALRDMLKRAAEKAAEEKGASAPNPTSESPASSWLDLAEIEILSSIYYNIKFLRCSYAEALHSKIDRYERLREMEIKERASGEEAVVGV